LHQLFSGKRGGFGCDFLVAILFRFWLFQDYCEEIIHHGDPTRLRATKTHNISRKGAKAAKNKTSGLGVLGVLARANPVFPDSHGPREKIRVICENY
jgi:hypothetical protein